MKKKIVICLILMIAIITIFFITRKKIENGSEEENSSLPISYDDENKENDETQKKEEQEKVEKIIEDQGFKADENIYEIEKEYDGREVAVVKSNIKYKVALAGSIKRQKPEFSEINSILENAPKHTGIWLEESSREKFLEAIKNITKATYEINEDGYLVQKENWMMNEFDKKILEMIKGDKLNVIDISSITYVVDDVTGEIQEYPFEEMDPYTEYEYFENNDKVLFVVNEGLMGKVKIEDCLKKIFE